MVERVDPNNFHENNGSVTTACILTKWYCRLDLHMRTDSLRH